ncbi:MAG: GH3 auxin-responsive promoter family protein, partial [Balneolaceae bacterium]|nr:GH3 auxin-responsive promoter family protein [Balneolaceae bacterium]
MVSLLAKGLRTRYGRRHNFGDVHSYADFSDIIPIGFYPDLKEDIEAMKKGEPDILWPGEIHNFAASAGTTGSGKHLPVSEERLASDRRFMRKVALGYLQRNPKIYRLFGKHLTLPGTVEERNGIRIGEISGFSAQRSPWWLRPFQLADPRQLTRLPFKEKFDTVLQASLQANVKVIVAVPSWILTLFQRALEATGKSSVSEIWPKLQLMVCGGVRLTNYRPHLEKLAEGLELDFIETYGSSEGYFAFTDDPKRDDMRLVYDSGIFYEFSPEPLPDMESLTIQRSLPLWEVEAGVPYAMLVTT